MLDNGQRLPGLVLVAAESKKRAAAFTDAPLLEHLLNGQFLPIKRDGSRSRRCRGRSVAVGQPVLDDRPQGSHRAVLVQMKLADQVESVAGVALMSAEVLEPDAPGSKLPAPIAPFKLRQAVIERDKAFLQVCIGRRLLRCRGVLGSQHRGSKQERRQEECRRPHIHSPSHCLVAK